MVENIAYKRLSVVTWPMLLDYSNADCRRILRKHELETYAKVVTTFRAQGLLTGEKRKILEDLRRLLSITCDRHRAEVRRAVNDEELATISEFVCGKDTDENWVIEGRRVSPILQRGIPQTAFMHESDAVAKKWAFLNSQLPQPSETAFSPGSSNLNAAKLNATLRDDATPNHTICHSLGSVNNEPKASVALPKNNVEEDAKTVPIMVPEAAVEITCEAYASKSISTPSLFEEKTSLIAELPVAQTSHRENSNIQRIPSPSVNEAQPTSQPKSSAHVYVPGFKRILPFVQSPQVTNFATEIAPRAPHPSAVADNGIVPLISTQNFVIRQNKAPTSPSQNVQINKIPSINSTVAVSGLGRINPATSTATGLTSVGVTHATSVATYVCRPINTSHVVKNCSSAVGYHQHVPSAIQFSASSILADNRKQKQHHKSIVVQQQHSQIAGSASGNVIVVHRGPSNRLVTSNSTVANSSHVSVTTNLPSTLPTSSPIVSLSSRPVRIRPVNNAFAIPVATSTGNTTFTPLLSATQLQTYNYQPTYRLSNPTTILCNNSGSPASGVSIVKMPIGGTGGYTAKGLLSRSAVTSNTTLPSMSPPSPGQVNSPALASVLEPKRPRLALVPAAASPSASQ